MSAADQILEDFMVRVQQAGSRPQWNVPFLIREAPQGVRVLAPTGRLGYVPEESLEEVLAAGAKVMNSDDMRQLRQEVFMQHGIFKEQHTRPTKRKRRSIVRSGRR
jgi:hypothetical protein